ncbi:MAG: hypothetical protein D4R84_02855 [Rhodocyclaceae bacterium]|nr:MAG: hypothetical protein D4R84_02855 [Rhodocyclaceae bacterium]
MESGVGGVTVVVNLGHVADVVSGVGFPKEMQGNAEGEVPVFKVGDISIALKNGTRHLRRSPNHLTKEAAKLLSKNLMPAGTTIFAKIGEGLKLNRRGILAQPSLVDNNVMGLIPKAGVVSPDYLYYFMQTVDLGELSQATAIPSVRKSDVVEIRIPLRVLRDQENIVAEIEKQFSRLDEAVAGLKRVKANIKRYRASVLDAFFADEPNVCLGDVIETGPQNGLYLPKSAYGSGTPMLRIDDYQTNWMRPVAELRRVNATDAQIAAWALREGDLVVNRVNSMSHLGKCASMPASLAGALFESNMMRMGLKAHTLPRYVELYLGGSRGRGRLTQRAKWAVNQASINQQDLLATPLPLPDIDRQREIVAEVDRLLSIAREAEVEVDTNLRRVQSLRQAILSAAFSNRNAIT